MKRIAAGIISLLVLISTLAGCGSNSSSSESAGKSEVSTQVQDNNQNGAGALTGKITFATNRTDLADTKLKELAAMFKQKYPETEIEIEGLKDPDSILKTRMAANELSDVTLVPKSIAKADLPKYYASLNSLNFFTKDNLYFYDAGVQDGNLYKITGTVLYEGIVYNKKVFEKAGVKVPVTMEEFLDVCEKIKAQGIVPVGTNFKEKWPNEHWLQEYAVIKTGNGNYLNELADKNEILTGEGLEGLNLLRELRQKGYTDPDLMSTNWDGSKKDMVAEKIAMIFLGSWYPQQVVDNGAIPEDIGMFPFPGGKGVEVADDWYFAVSKESKNLDTAKEFLKFAYENGRMHNLITSLSPMKDVKVEDKFANELLSYNTPVIELTPKSDSYMNLINKSGIDVQNMIQEYILANNPDQIISKYNQKWANVKK